MLVHQKGLVKTVNFSVEKGKYVGDPINAVKIFNEKHVDEIMVIDIDATIENREPDYDLIKNVAIECRMPLCYGGGVKTVDQVRKIISLGAEKVAISSAAIKDMSLIERMSEAVGAQSIVLVLDVKKQKSLFKSYYEIYIMNGKEDSNIKLDDFLDTIKDLPYGEIVINNIDRDGTMSGYDMDLAQMVRDKTDVPMTILGGASSLDDISQLVKKFNIIGAAAGSIFVFKGKYKAVLISYPSITEKKQNQLI